MIVMKFGGTSVESAAAIERVAGIVKRALPRRPLVVVSAMGKTTNRLLECAQLAAQGRMEAALDGAKALEEFHKKESSAVTLPQDKNNLKEYLAQHFAELRSTLQSIASDGEIQPYLWDEVTSYGERLSSLIAAKAFRFFGIAALAIDARQVLITDGRHTQAQPNYARTNARFNDRIPLLLEKEVVVMGGFIGATAEGVTTTLGRGGSDFSAAIAGAALAAEEIQIWTDVDGMLTCDPRILPGGHLIKRISFDEAAELAYFGAKVLHPATVLPAVEKSIPVMILNSRRPEAVGTRISTEVVASKNPVKSIACKKGITVVTIQSLRMLMAYGFLRRIFEVFDRYRTPVDMVTTSEVSVSLTIDDTGRMAEIQEELSRIAEVKVEGRQAIVCLVGDSLQTAPGAAARVFSALAGKNVRMISQGASRRNISLVVEESELEGAVAALHQEFFRELDAEVFAA